ncbi:MAG: tRNA 5-methoxyuridine(34)/uridine 5-oxyacetic acid(34) synthase CmoB [Candidatus Margulisiibacteriota bacterium]
MRIEAFLPQLHAAVLDRAKGYLNPTKQAEFAVVLQAREARFENPNTRRFLEAFLKLPEASSSVMDWDSPAVLMGQSEDVSAKTKAQLHEALMGLKPWRKGPFSVFGVEIEAEWDSDLKWQRLLPHLPPLTNKTILDVGSNNGYYQFRMLAHNPRWVLGIDPMDLYPFQFQALQRYAQQDTLGFAGVGIEAMGAWEGVFEVVFCMGVLYHQRSPLHLLERLFRLTRPGGTVILETLIIEDPRPIALYPQNGRYAKMSNVHFLPSLSCLQHWLAVAGFVSSQVAFVATTTVQEQRATPWSTPVSLADFLDPQDPNKTVEGLPAPIRAAIVVQKP